MFKLWFSSTCDVEDVSICVLSDGECNVCHKNDNIKLYMHRDHEDEDTNGEKEEASISVCLQCVYQLAVGIVQHDTIQKVAHPTECCVCQHPAALTFTDPNVPDGEILSLCHECVSSAMFETK